MTGCEMIKDI